MRLQGIAAARGKERTWALARLALWSSRYLQLCVGTPTLMYNYIFTTRRMFVAYPYHRASSYSMVRRRHPQAASTSTPSTRDNVAELK